jgi:mannose-6-phosphate isomerase
MHPLRFIPLYKERPWGGRNLGQLLGRTLPAGGPIGESWDLVDRADAQSVVADGPRSGMSLRQLLAIQGRSILGFEPQGRRFPLLVKWLDCRERLSLQVHPPAAMAATLGGEPKTENWYVVSAEPGAGVYAGLKPGVTPPEFLAAQREDRLEELLVRLPVTAGDSVFVPSGTVHAIDAGCVILEVQQNSDTTYRVHDWGRVGPDGKPRELHLKKSAASIDWRAPPARVIPAKPGLTLVDAPEFRLRQLSVTEGQALLSPRSGQAAVICVVHGGVSLPDGRVLAKGDVALVPADFEEKITATRDSVILSADRFPSA